RDDDINLKPDELGGNLGIALAASLRPAILDLDGATLDPAKFAQPPDKSGGPLAHDRRRSRAQEPDGWQLSRLLRARRERPRGCRAAECGQQFPPSDGDCHTLLPREARKWNDTTPRWCSLHVQGTGCWLLPP